MQVVAQEVGGARQSATAKVEILFLYFQAMLNIADASFHVSMWRRCCCTMWVQDWQPLGGGESGGHE